jgi:hypothetical protein
MEQHLQELLRQTIKAIDAQFGRDYAKKNPQMVSALLRAGTSTYRPNSEMQGSEQE